MAEFISSLSQINPHFHRSCIKDVAFPSKSFNPIKLPRNYSCGSCKLFLFAARKGGRHFVPQVPVIKVSRCLLESSMSCSCLGSLVDPDGAAAIEWASDVDQVLLLVSMFLTYVAGVVPTRKASSHSQKETSDGSVVFEGSTFSGSFMKNDDQVSSPYAWDAVKRKLRDSLNAVEHVGILGRITEFEQPPLKRSLSLYAIADAPRFRLLWASFQHLEKEVKNIPEGSGTMDRNDWMVIFDGIMQRFSEPVCVAWLEKEISLERSNCYMEPLSSIFKRLNEEKSILKNIKKSGKMDLFADLLYLLRFGSLREGCLYGDSLFIHHGIAILEDMVINLADGISSIYLDLISVDSNVSNEINRLGLNLCTLSTRALQKLRNELALDRWLHQNMEAIAAMYEDRFDLYTLQSEVIEDLSETQAETDSWWKLLTVRKSGKSPRLHYVVIGQISVSTKRTMELRALTGWGYYFSLFLELSDIGMPIIKAVLANVSSAISFFLVSLIGRSLGLIFTGIRQSLRWK
ncbi:hypothetical protein RJ641_030074 [Dillenia turbinata]|uniref:Uncharacterized protein n=1 Tax=Dillenia turbinata TaxID=194707 RepID=A0AAN8W5Z3_9MAGN